MYFRDFSSAKWLTIAGSVVPGEFLEICSFEAFMVSVNRPHDARPRLLEAQVSFALALQLFTVFVENNRHDTEEWEGLEEKHRLEILSRL